MATINKKAKPKEPRPEIVLRKPRTPSDIHTLTPHELFRLTIDKKPFVGMVLDGGTTMIAWDKNGYPATFQTGSSTARASMAFIDYLTDDEGVFIPGSAEDRVVAEAREAEKPAQIMPDDRSRIDLIPDGFTYIWGRQDDEPEYRYEARNFSTKKGGRVTLLIAKMGGETWTECNPYLGYTAFEIIEDPNPARWETHARRAERGVI